MTYHPETNLSTCIGEKLDAEKLGLSVKTLRRWRQQMRGPQYYKIGCRVVYSTRDLADFLEQRAVKPIH